MNDDEYRAAIGYPGYEVHALGLVRSWLKTGPEPGLRTQAREIRAARDKKSGLWCVQVTSGHKWCRVTVASLVLEAFGKLRPSVRARAYYRDGDRDNLSLANLEWRATGAAKRRKATLRGHERRRAAARAAAGMG